MTTDPMPPVYMISMHGACDDCDAVQDLGFYTTEINYALPEEFCTLCNGVFRYEQLAVEEMPKPEGNEEQPPITQLPWPDGPVVLMPLDLYWSLFEFYKYYRLMEPMDCGLSGVHINPDEARKLHDYCNHLDQYAAILQSIVQEPLMPEE